MSSDFKVGVFCIPRRHPGNCLLTTIRKSGYNEAGALFNAAVTTMDEITRYNDDDTTRATAPIIAELWHAAEAGGFAAQFADLRAAEFVAHLPDGSQQRKRLTPAQAWFVAWFGADEAIREPKTLKGAAQFLNKSRTVLYNWQAADWFTLTGVQTWERRFLAGHIPALYRKLMDTAINGDGAASNAAIKMALDAWGKHTGQDAGGGNATAAVQVNVNGSSVQVVEQAKSRLQERLADLAGRVGSDE